MNRLYRETGCLTHEEVILAKVVTVIFTIALFCILGWTFQGDNFILCKMHKANYDSAWNELKLDK